VQPHRTHSFKLSTDPFFIEKVRDLVGLYLNPPSTRWYFALTKKPGSGLHFTPTYSSWLNQGERSFALTTNQSIRRGSFESVTELKRQVNAYVDHP